MAVQWLSINDVRRLMKENMLSIKDGKVFDKRQGKETRIPPYIVERLESFSEDDWDNGGGW